MTAADLRVAWLGHSTVVLDLGGVRLVTDPLLRRHNGPLRRRGPAPDRRCWAGADAVLLSHLHHDHAELASLRMLAGVPVVTGAANAAWLRRHRLAGVDPGDGWYDAGGGVSVRLVHAVHHCPADAAPSQRRPRSPGAYGGGDRVDRR